MTLRRAGIPGFSKVLQHWEGLACSTTPKPRRWRPHMAASHAASWPPFHLGTYIGIAESAAA